MSDSKEKKPPKKAATVKADLPDNKPQPESKGDRKSWNIGKFLWGTLLISFGVLFLLGNLGLIAVDYNQLWQLWPLAIIVAGLSLLTVRGWPGILLAVISGIAIVSIVALAASGAWAPANTLRTQDASITIENGDVNKIDLNLDSGAGTLDIMTSDTAQAVTANLRSNYSNLEQESRTQNGTQHVELSLENNNQWWRGNMRNDLSVLVPESIPLSLNIDAGAAEIKADLTQAQVERLNVDSGASSMRLKVGDKVQTTNIDISTGASSVTLLVPRSAGVSLLIDGGLSSHSVADLREVGDGRYESDGFENSEKKIRITVEMGVSSFTLERY